MDLAIRDVQECELDAVLVINNTASQSILPMDKARLRYFFDHADYFRVAEINGHLAGFLLALRDGGNYNSINYRWFCEHYPQFLYIDRIVIASAYQRHGLGRVFYCDVESFAEVRVPLLACEIFLEPRDDIAMLFHGTYGFHEVGQQRATPQKRRVSLLVKELPGYSYVHDTWIAHGGLPDQPWLASRQIANVQVIRPHYAAVKRHS